MKILLMVVAIAWGCGPSARAEPPEKHPVSVRLIAEHAKVAPGGTVWLGVHFQIQDQWHIYWNGYSESGAPTTITLSVPPGYRAGEVHWPAPRRYLSEGDILDHVYEKQVTLLIPLTAPDTATPGDRIDLTADVAWLVCKEACIPGDAKLSFSLAIAERDEKPHMSRDASLFTAARRELPKPPGASGAEYTATWEGSTLILKSRSHKHLEFYPQLESTELTNPIADGISKTGELRLRLENPGRVLGVLRISPDAKGASPTVVSVDVNPATSQASPP